MTRDEAIFLILSRCGQRQDDTKLQQACVLEMALAQETQLEQAHFKPWFLISENTMALTSAGEDAERIPLPSDFLEEHDEGTLWVRDKDATQIWTPLFKDDYDTLRDRFTDLGQPSFYSIVGPYITLFPTPIKSYQLRMRYYKKQPKILTPYGAANQPVVTNAWLTHAADWLIGETGRIIASQHVKDPEAAAVFSAEAETAKQRLYVQHVAREETNRQRSMGDD